MLSTFQEKVHTFGVRRGTLGGWKRHFCGVRKSLSNPIGSDSVSELVWRRSAAAARIPPGPKFSSPSFFSNFLVLVQFSSPNFFLRVTPKTAYS